MQTKRLWPSAVFILLRLFCCLLLTNTFVVVQAAEITIDGKLDEVQWQTAQIIDDFVFTDPDTGEPADKKTQARFFTDEKGLYIGFVNHQNWDERTRIYNRQDQLVRSDFNRVVVDFEGKGSSAFEFTVALGGGFGEGIYVNGNQFSDDWEGHWKFAVSEDKQAWYSEIFLPWNIALYISEEGDKSKKMGIWFNRVISKKGSDYSFPNTHWSRSNFLRELYPIQSEAVDVAPNFTFIPQITLQYDTQRQKQEYNLGGDLLYRPSTDKLFMATIMPDFGTADADELVANFSPVEVFFPENRTFFTENHSLFDLKDNKNKFVLVNTRRIGAATDGAISVPAKLEYAGKFVSVGTTVDSGLMYASEKDVGTAQGKTFFVARSKAHLQEGYVGSLLTVTDRPEIERKAYSVAIDLSLWSQEGVFDVLLLGSRIDDQFWSTGTGLYLDGKYALNRGSNISAQLTLFDAQLDLNDAGFIERNNTKKLELSADTTLYDLNDNVYELYLEAGTAFNRNFDGEQLASSLNVGGALKDYDAWEYLFELNYKLSGVDDLISFGFGSVNLPSQKDIVGQIATPSGSNTQFVFVWNYYQEGLSGWTHAVETIIRYAFNDSVNMELSANLLESNDWLIGNGLGQLERFKRSFRELDLKFLWLISQNQELNMRLQWNGLSAKGLELFNISEQGLVSQGRAEDFADSQLSMQLKYRYFFAPFSDVMVVYSRQGSIFTDDLSKVNFGNLFDYSFRGVKEDLVTLKIRYAF